LRIHNPVFVAGLEPELFDFGNVGLPDPGRFFGIALARKPIGLGEHPLALGQRKIFLGEIRLFLYAFEVALVVGDHILAASDPRKIGDRLVGLERPFALFERLLKLDKVALPGLEIDFRKLQGLGFGNDLFAAQLFGGEIVGGSLGLERLGILERLGLLLLGGGSLGGIGFGLGAKLLEYGADPDGLESADSWSYIKLGNGDILPVSPMDCALLGGNEDCQLLLELYGGVTLHEHLTDED
jgi:hypothetical protein